RFHTGESAEVIGLIDADERRDLALIQVRISNSEWLKVSTKDPEVGSRAYVIGAPLGLEFSISDGLISQVQSVENGRVYQFSCPASPGNSGGPLVDESGNVLGVVSWQFKTGQNLNFAVPAIYITRLEGKTARSWDTISPKSQPDETGSEQVDKVLADGLVDTYDEMAILTASVAEMRPHQGLRVPAAFYTYQLTLAADEAALKSTVTSDLYRRGLISRLLNEIELIRTEMNLFIDFNDATTQDALAEAFSKLSGVLNFHGRTRLKVED